MEDDTLFFVSSFVAIDPTNWECRTRDASRDEKEDVS